MAKLRVNIGDTDENADWLKYLPEHEGEVELHEKLRERRGSEKGCEDDYEDNSIVDRLLLTAIKSVQSLSSTVRQAAQRRQSVRQSARQSAKQSAMKQTEGEIRYRSDISNTVELLWKGSIDKNNFIGLFEQEVPIAFEHAWLAGAEAAGISSLEELTEDERDALQDRIDDELDYVEGFADYIIEHNKEAGYSLDFFDARISMWAGRYGQVMDLARGMALADQKFEWIFGDTTDHCRDCSNAAGRVYRASTWDKYGWIPGSQALACRGYRCDCRREPTDKPVTPGRPPNIKGPHS